MSLLLDALHRSDQERNNDSAVPGIQTRHGESAISHAPARLLLAGLGLLLLIVLLLWLIFGGSQGEEGGVAAVSDPATVTAPATAAAATAAAATAAASPSTNEVVQPIPAASQKPEITAKASPAEKVPALPVPPGSHKHSSAGQGMPVPREVAELYQRSAVPVSANPEPDSLEPAPAVAENKTLPVEAIVAAAQQELAAPPLDDDQTPLVQDLPQRTKDEIPTIYFSSHSWSSQASEKQVTLNGQVRREGDTVLPGVRLIEILPESIVLDFQGTRFRLRALNSWVNL